MNSDPMFDLLVRPAEPADYEAAGDLVVESYIAAGILSDDRGYDLVLRDVAGRAASATVLVAVHDGEVVGTGTIAIAGTEHAEIARGTESEFRYFGVRTDMWGHGIGDALVVAAEEAARSRGATHTVMSVISHNAPALAMYGKAGYARVPERDWHPAPDIALLVLSKELV
jgi:GNAT superfamily N-acetyltransferase